MKLSKTCTILAEDLVAVIRDQNDVIAYDRQNEEILVVGDHALTLMPERYVHLLAKTNLGDLSKLEGLSDGKLEAALEVEKVNYFNTALHDDRIRPRVFPALAEALR
jgi:hypothetical protein